MKEMLMVSRQRINQLRYPERQQARSAVTSAIEQGVLPPVSTLYCVYCGEPARQYHHHIGYGQNERLAVWPACDHCHGQIAKPRQFAPERRKPLAEYKWYLKPLPATVEKSILPALLDYARQNELTDGELADRLKISRTTFTFYKTARRAMNKWFVSRIRSAFPELPSDLFDDMAPVKDGNGRRRWGPTHGPIAPLVIALVELQDKEMIIDSDFAKELGVSTSTWNVTRRGGMPLGPKLLRGAMLRFPELFRQEVDTESESD